MCFVPRCRPQVLRPLGPLRCCTSQMQGQCPRFNCNQYPTIIVVFPVYLSTLSRTILHAWIALYALRLDWFLNAKIQVHLPMLEVTMRRVKANPSQTEISPNRARPPTLSPQGHTTRKSQLADLHMQNWGGRESLGDYVL